MGITDETEARYRPAGRATGHPRHTRQPALDRRSGAAVVVHRRPLDTDVGVAWATLRRRAGLDHPVLAPVADAWIHGDELVVVEVAVAGTPLAEQAGELGTWPPARLVEELLGPLAEGLDALHASGLACGRLDADAIVLARTTATTWLPVLTGVPEPGGDPAADRRLLAALAGAPPPDPEVRSCAALVDHLAALAAPSETPLPSVRRRALRALLERTRR